MTYEILEAEDAETLQRKVRARIEQDWEPIGGVSVYSFMTGRFFPNCVFAQAMIKRVA